MFPPQSSRRSPHAGGGDPADEGIHPNPWIRSSRSIETTAYFFIPSCRQPSCPDIMGTVENRQVYWIASSCGRPHCRPAGTLQRHRPRYCPA